VCADEGAIGVSWNLKRPAKFLLYPARNSEIIGKIYTADAYVKSNHYLFVGLLSIKATIARAFPLSVLCDVLQLFTHHVTLAS